MQLSETLINMTATLDNVGAVQDCSPRSLLLEQQVFELFTLLVRSTYCVVRLAGASLYDVLYGAVST